MTLTRRTVLSRAGVAAAAPFVLRWPAQAAEFAYKYGTALPDGHPMVIRSKEAAAKIKEESGGKLDIALYSSSVLGQDTAMMSQAISGALEIYGMSLDILAQRSPSAAIFGVGFAFPDYPTAWKAMDGELGGYCRGLSGKVGLHCLDKAFDHGFRQITMKSKPINGPDDLKGVKIRLPVAPLFISLFQHLGASPTPINFGEVYSALQTGLVDGQENPLILIDTAKLYEVQKYCSMTNHVWAGIHYSFGNAYWDKLPNDLKDLSNKHFDAAALTERDDWQKMSADETKNLTSKGMTFNTPDVKPFQEVLKKAGFFGEMKKKSGDKAWGLLEKYVGPLA